MEGMNSNADRALTGPDNIALDNFTGGGTYTSPNDARRDPTLQDYENIFGPAARDIKLDLQRAKRHSRWHLPDALKGSNPWLADRIDGLITDTTASPFTSLILPYYYIENVDQKIKWNRWSFDEGLASRVPYESAARTLTQTKKSYAGYTIRQGLAITMEHNFMMSEKGRENFKNQLQQVVSSIQYTNDIDVTVALITAHSYAKEQAEKYYMEGKTNHQTIREFINMFGFMQKNPNAMDIMIEEAKNVLRGWGAEEPSFMLTNSKLTFNMQMNPEKTSYLSQGPEGQRRLRQGPDLKSYRGLSIINSRAFSMETGAVPRDVLRRRVRVAEYHRIPWHQGVESEMFELYDESKDAWQRFTWADLFKMSEVPESHRIANNVLDIDFVYTKLPGNAAVVAGAGPNVGDTLNFRIKKDVWDSITYDTVRPAPPAGGGGGGVVGFFTTLHGFTGAYTPQPPGPVMLPAAAVAVPNYVYPQITQNQLYELYNIDAANPDVPNQDIEGQIKEFIQDLRNFMQGTTLSFDQRKMQLFLNLRLNSPRIPAVVGGAPAIDSQIYTVLNALFNFPAAIGFADNDNFIKQTERTRWELVIVRPCIEHSMFGIILGRGGIDPLGATLWGQTELSVYDDAMHGIWGMSYKYNERAIVFNHKNLIRLWDVSYDAYQGGKDCTAVSWTSAESVERFKESVYELSRAYEGPSMMVMRFPDVDTSEPWPSPIVFHDPGFEDSTTTFLDGEHQHRIKRAPFRVFNRASYHSYYRNYLSLMPNFSKIHNPKDAGHASEENETTATSLAFQGTMNVYNENGEKKYTISGNGHHGVDRVGIAVIRSGKGVDMGSMAEASAMRLI